MVMNGFGWFLDGRNSALCDEGVFRSFPKTGKTNVEKVAKTEVLSEVPL